MVDISQKRESQNTQKNLNQILSLHKSYLSHKSLKRDEKSVTIVSKVFEKVICNQTKNCLKENIIIFKEYFNFRQKMWFFYWCSSGWFTVLIRYNRSKICLKNAMHGIPPTSNIMLWLFLYIKILGLLFMYLTEIVGTFAMEVCNDLFYALLIFIICY